MHRNLSQCYKLLEVSRDASTGSIKRAYKRLAIRWHPDKNRGRTKEAEEKFKQISEAYSVVINPFIKKNYGNNTDIVFGSFDLPGIFGDELEIFDFDQTEELLMDSIIESISTSSSSNSESLSSGSRSPIENNSLNEKRTGEFLFDEDDDDLVGDPEIEGRRCKANKRVKKSAEAEEREER